MSIDTLASAAATGEQGAASFLERKEMQLRQERGARQPETDNDSSQSGNVETPQRQAEDGDVIEESAELVDQPEHDDIEAASDDAEADEADEQAIADEPDDDSEDSDELPEVAEIRAQLAEAEERAQAAEEKAKSFERDYRKKTAKNGERTRELDQRGEVLEEAFKAVLHREQSELAQYQSLDWSALASDPERYQQLKQAHQAAYNRVEQSKAQLKQALEFTQAQKQKDLEYQTSVGREILQTEVPDWGPERYAQARQTAVDKYGMTEGEVDQITDYRSMLILLDAMKYHELKSSTPKVVKKLGKKRGKRAPSRRTGTPQDRNTKGQYQAARDKVAKRPGDKDSFLEMKQKQLKMERERRW